MTLIELLNKIANNEVKDKTKYRIHFEDIDGDKLYRDIYYDQSEPTAMDCLKNISDDYPIYDEISFTDTIIEEAKGGNMEIEVGEYIRTRQGKIDKVEEIKTISTKMDGNHIYGYKLKNNNAYWIEKEWIVKHSKDIIDLVQKGDYVNGYLVLDIDLKNEMICLLMPFNEENQSKFNVVWKTKYFIKTILTHEMYEQNCYKLKE